MVTNFAANATGENAYILAGPYRRGDISHASE
jgi:hypothetical protein